MFFTRKMNFLSFSIIVSAVPNLVIADELAEMQMNADHWVMPAGNYNNQRYSKLDKISENNIHNLNLAWSFSTGVLRGHEGNVLVIDDTMYVHTPFPNLVFALDLNNDGWAGIGMVMPSLDKDSDGDGAVGAYRALSSWTNLGGVLSVFSV